MYPGLDIITCSSSVSAVAGLSTPSLATKSHTGLWLLATVLVWVLVPPSVISTYGSAWPMGGEDRDT